MYPISCHIMPYPPKMNYVAYCILISYFCPKIRTHANPEPSQVPSAQYSEHQNPRKRTAASVFAPRRANVRSWPELHRGTFEISWCHQGCPWGPIDSWRKASWATRKFHGRWSVEWFYHVTMFYPVFVDRESRHWLLWFLYSTLWLFNIAMENGP